MASTMNNRRDASQALAPVREHPRVPLPVAKRDKRPLMVTTYACEPFSEMEPHALGLTYWFDAAAEGEPYAVTVRFTGRRAGVTGLPGPNDSFDVTEIVKHVVPGSGRLAITVRVLGIAPGEWQVTAMPVNDPRSRVGAKKPTSAQPPRLPSASSSGATGFAPFIQVCAPGVRLGAWPALVGLGAVAGLVTQAALAMHSHLPVAMVLLVSLAASLVGLVGAKIYYLAEQYLTGHRGDQRPAVLAAGMCIQGFVAGTVGTLILEALIFGLPFGRVLDVTAPGMFLAMTIGRFGCFFGGCCAGRPTSSRWGLWSSDRRLGARRIPTQLLESAAALSIALSAFLAVWNATPHPSGVVFVGATASYTLARQLLFPLRDNPRNTAHGRILTMALAALIVVVDVAVAVLT